MFNIGYTVAMNLTKNYWQCFIFHDVDLLPEDDRNLYTCPNNPRHMSVGTVVHTANILLVKKGNFSLSFIFHVNTYV